ncbi:phospholipase A2 family protein [Brevibacillus marinus]|uniref:phospholipase A2 family protein n=1 Tax=Brevibacillus marinus TaxID=2496837 RepID=UPI000F82C3DC|nr:phospholipase A2 family protein [Brevibacillus marinus]
MSRRKKKPPFPGFCFHGNWCGPGCRGPEPPIDDVDACCMLHDKCYQRHGYFSCRCDKKFRKCLREKRDLRSEKGRKAAVMYSYFQRSWCW